MFTGREYDSETGLYFYRARYYDPAIGRFIQEDPIGFKSGEVNFYIYSRNNPINYKDPNGLDITGTIIGGGVGGIIGGTLGGAIGLGGGMSLGTLVFPGVGTVTMGLTGAQAGELMGAAIGTIIGGVIGDTIEDFITYMGQHGKQNQRDSKLQPLSDAEISRRAHDNSLSPGERRRYQKEEKARGERNVKKRKGCQ